MKKFLLSLALAVVAICASAAVGDTFSVGNLSYVVTGDATTINYASVDVTGLSATGKSASNLGLIIPSTVTYNGTVYRVSYVKPSAFANQSNIVHLSIHYGVTDLNESAFKNCTGIVWVRMPSSMRYIYSHVFEGCTALKRVYIANPDPSSGVFNSDAFPSNSGMTLYVPRTNANSVQLYKARKCFEKFATITKSSGAYDVNCNDGAYLCVTKAPNKTTAGEMTLVGFDSEGSLVVDGAFVPSCGTNPYGFENYKYDFVAVADSACLGHSSLKSVNISACTKFTTIGIRSFGNCTNLTSFAMATTSLKEIKSGAFFGCKSLTSITIPSGVTSCSPYFVDGCSSLNTINVHSSNTIYSSYNGMLYDKTQTQLLRCPEGHTSISLVSANSFPATLQKVGVYAFYGCSKIKYVYLPYGVQLVSSYAFTNCANLLTMKVPSSVTTWGNSVFGGATKLELLYMNMQRPPAVRDEEFKNIERTTLVVPYSSWNSYKTAEGWKTWKNIKHGAFDIAAFDFVNASTGQTWSTNYTIHSNKKENINGKSYDGRAKLVWVDRNNATGVLKIPEYITDLTSNKKYAVTAIDSEVANDGFGADVSLTLGENVDTISESAFSGRTSLINLTLNANLTHIAEYAFYDCRIANALDLPYGLKYLGSYAFYNNSFKHLLIPSSLKSFGVYAIAKNNHLEELVINGSYWSKATNWDLTNVPSSCKLYVPTGCVQQYKSNPQWGKLNVMAGAYDFTFNNGNMNNTRYHMTVTSATPVTVNGVTYDGKAKYVYHPAVATIQATAFIGTNSEKNVTNGGSKSYLMTEFGDSLLAGAASATEVSVSDMKNLVRIGDYALYGTGIKTFTVPASCEYVGKNAFVNCRSLTELFLTKSENGLSWNGQFYGLNASGFKCYVHWTSYPSFKNSIKNWSKFTTETDYPTDRLNGYLQITGDNTATSFSIDHPVDWNATGLKAFAVNGYGSLTNLVYTQPVYSTPAATGLLVEGFQKNQIYKLIRPASTPATPTNLLKGTATGLVDVFGENVGFLFANSQKYFWKPTSTYKLNTGYAYLVLPSSLVGSTTRIYVDRWPQGLKGDVNGDGVVNVSDVTALINKILGTASYSDSVCDIDGNGTVNVSDVTALINLILG